MTIAIDASRAINESAGIGRYTRELLEAILKVGQNHQFILIFTYWRANEDKAKQIKSYRGKNIEIRTAKIPGTLKEKIWRGKSGLYNQLFQGADVVLAPSFLEFKRGLKLPQVTIVHDMTTFLFPDQRGLEVSKRLSQQALVAIENSEKTLAISKSTKKDIGKYVSLSENKVAVIYPGLTVFEKPSTELPKKFNLKIKKYILFVGTIEPRKNLRRLLTAYRQLTTEIKNKYPLVIVGASGWNNDLELKTMGEMTGVKWLGYVPDDVLACLYKEAAVFIYPSLYEGFGLPILEAMAAGTPVITSNRSSMPEAAGIAGVLINPTSAKSITEGLQAVLEGKISRRQLVNAGKAQTKKFSWEKSAEEVIKVLEGATGAIGAKDKIGA